MISRANKLLTLPMIAFVTLTGFKQVDESDLVRPWDDEPPTCEYVLTLEDQEHDSQEFQRIHDTAKDQAGMYYLFEETDAAFYFGRWIGNYHIEPDFRDMAVKFCQNNPNQTYLRAVLETGDAFYEQAKSNPAHAMCKSYVEGLVTVSQMESEYLSPTSQVAVDNTDNIELYKFIKSGGFDYLTFDFSTEVYKLFDELCRDDTEAYAFAMFGSATREAFRRAQIEVRAMEEQQADQQ